MRHINKLGHGSIAVAQQIAYWHTINRHIHMKTIKFSSNLFRKRNLIHDNFFDTGIHHQYQEQFNKYFSNSFNMKPNDKTRFFSRYERNFLLYHSLRYSNRKKSNNFIETTQDSSDFRKSATVEIIFFFSICDEDFVFF